MQFILVGQPARTCTSTSIKNSGTNIQTRACHLRIGFYTSARNRARGRSIGYPASNQAKIFYSDNGSTAVEVAIKMTMQYWYNTDRKNFLAFETVIMVTFEPWLGARSPSANLLANLAFSGDTSANSNSPKHRQHHCQH